MKAATVHTSSSLCEVLECAAQEAGAAGFDPSSPVLSLPEDPSPPLMRRSHCRAGGQPRGGISSLKGREGLGEARDMPHQQGSRG